MAIADTYRQLLKKPAISRWKTLQKDIDTQIDEAGDLRRGTTVHRTKLRILIQILRLRADMYNTYKQHIPDEIRQTEAVFLDGVLDGQYKPEDWPTFVSHDDWLWWHVQRVISLWYIEQTGRSLSRATRRIEKIAEYLDGRQRTLANSKLGWNALGWDVAKQAVMIGSSGARTLWITER